MDAMSDHESDDDVEITDVGTDNNLLIRLRCKAFNKRPYDFKLTMNEFFEGMNIGEPLFRLPDAKISALFIKMQSQDDKDRLLQLSKEEKDLWVLYKSPVTASAMWEAYECARMTRTFTRAKEGALDIILPHRKIKYETQLKLKVEVLKTFATLADSNAKHKLEFEKRIEKRYFPNIPTIEEPIKSPNESGFFTEYVKINLEYDAKKKQIEAGVKVFSSPAKSTYYFLPIKDCIHIAPPIIAVVESFVEYLTSNMEDLKEFKDIDEEAKTGLVNELQCIVGDTGEILLTVVLAYYGNNEECFPLEEIDHLVSLKEMLAWYRSQQNGDNKSDEQMEVDPQEEPKTDKSKQPNWSSESGNPKGYNFVAQEFEDCHPSFRYFDFAQADSHLDVVVPFLRKFYQENKEKLNLHGIYVNWYNVSRRPLEWTRRIRVFHHVCGGIRVSKSVDAFPIHKFPFSWVFGPTSPNCGILLEQLAKQVDVKKNTDLAIACEFRSVFLFFAKKCGNIIALNDMTAENWGVAKKTKTRIIFTGHNQNQIDFAYRKAGVPPAALIIWGSNNTRSHVIKRFIEFGVKKVAVVFERAKSDSSDPTKKNPVVPELTRVNTLVYPYLSLKRIIPIDCDPGGRMLSIIALYEENKEAPNLPPVILHKLDPELESKLPPTALPPTPKRAAEDDDGPDSKRRRDNDGDWRGSRGGRGRGRGGGRVRDGGRGRGRDARGRGRGAGSGRFNDPEKSELLKQIEELKAEQEKMKKMLPAGARPGSTRDNTRSSSRELTGRDGPRQSGSRSGAWPDDSRRDVGRADRGGDRSSGSRDRYDSRDRNDVPRGRNDAPRSRNDAPRGLMDAPRSLMDAPRGRNDAPRSLMDAPRDRNDAPRGRNDAPRGSYGGSDGDRYGGGPSRSADSEKYVGSGYDFRNYASSSDNYSSRNDAGSGFYERRDSSNRGRDTDYTSNAPKGYRSAYDDIKTERSQAGSSPPPPPPPPLISRR